MTDKENYLTILTNCGYEKGDGNYRNGPTYTDEPGYLAWANEAKTATVHIELGSTVTISGAWNAEFYIAFDINGKAVDLGVWAD
jgi:hypothetical protein